MNKISKILLFLYFIILYENGYAGKHNLRDLDYLRIEEQFLRTKYVPSTEEEAILDMNDLIIDNLTKQLIFLRNNKEEERENECNFLIGDIKNRKLFRENYHEFKPIFEYKGEYYKENYYKVINYENFLVKEEFMVSLRELKIAINLFHMKRINFLDNTQLPPVRDSYVEIDYKPTKVEI